MRLDMTLVARNLYPSRTAAQQAIAEGMVIVNGVLVTKCSYTVNDTDMIVAALLHSYVSRGGLKLQHALQQFNIDPTAAICLDVGASTGGFTDCLLRHGANKVYAVDVGHSQLHETLRGDSRVINMENADIRNITLPELVDIIVVDVSFISAVKILSVVKSLLKSSGDVLVLVKPQFETSRSAKNKHGVVTDEKTRLAAVEHVRQYARENGWLVSEICQSPIAGGEGNIEYWLHLTAQV